MNDFEQGDEIDAAEAQKDLATRRAEREVGLQQSSIDCSSWFCFFGASLKDILGFIFQSLAVS